MSSFANSTYISGLFYDGTYLQSPPDVSIDSPDFVYETPPISSQLSLESIATQSSLDFSPPGAQCNELYIEPVKNPCADLYKEPSALKTKPTLSDNIEMPTEKLKAPSKKLLTFGKPLKNLPVHIMKWFIRVMKNKSVSEIASKVNKELFGPNVEKSIETARQYLIEAIKSYNNKRCKENLDNIYQNLQWRQLMRAFYSFDLQLLLSDEYSRIKDEDIKTYADFYRSEIDLIGGDSLCS